MPCASLIHKGVHAGCQTLKRSSVNTVTGCRHNPPDQSYYPSSVRLPSQLHYSARRPSSKAMICGASCGTVVCASTVNEHTGEEFVTLAHKLADAAGKIISKYFRAPIKVEAKADTSPVTVADRKAETAMRALIAEAYPEHGVFGEEEGLHLSHSNNGYLWVLDPIDGTKSFITGKPLFGTLIALLHEGRPILGIIDQPISKERWLGVMGRPTTLNGEEVRTRPCEDVRKAYLYATTPHMFEGEAATAFARVRDQVLHPLYGCDCYAYGLLAAGFCDLVVEADLKPYDYMALVPIVEGAGGVMTDWKGGKLRWPVTPSKAYTLQDLPGEVVAAGDSVAHKQALELLQWQEEESPAEYAWQS